MCGIYGIAGYGINKDDLKVFRELGIINLLRGRDGSGVYEANTRAIRTYEKLNKTKEDFSFFLWRHTESSQAAKEPEFRMMENVYADILMGHDRQATVGDVTDENAQPFAHGNIVGTHNGTLRDNEYRSKKDDRSDSDLFFEDISIRGVAEVLKDLDHHSAYAISILDKVEKCLYFARSDDRPLAMAINHKRNVLYWSSEPAALRYILNKNGIDFEGRNTEGKAQGSIFSLKAGTLFRVNIGDITSGKTIFTIEEKIFDWIEDKVKNTFSKVWYADEKKRLEKETKKRDKGLKKGGIETNIVPFRSHPTIPLPKPNSSLAQHTGQSGQGQGVSGKDLSKTCVNCGGKITVLEAYFTRKENDEDIYVNGMYDKENDEYYCYTCISGETAKIKENETTVH